MKGNSYCSVAFLTEREKAKGHSVFCKGHRPLLRGETVETNCVLSRKLSASPLFSVHQNLFSGSCYKSRGFLANRGLLWNAEGSLLVAVMSGKLSQKDVLRVAKDTAVRGASSLGAHPGSSSQARTGGDSLENMQVGSSCTGTHSIHMEHKIAICCKGVLL